jgi:hypothetical protein
LDIDVSLLPAAFGQILPGLKRFRQLPTWPEMILVARSQSIAFIDWPLMDFQPCSAFFGIFQAIQTTSLLTLIISAEAEFDMDILNITDIVQH